MTEAVFNITVNDNDILEETETFNVMINSSSLPNNVTIGELGEAVITILDNDGELLSNRKAITPLGTYLLNGNYLELSHIIQILLSISVVYYNEYVLIAGCVYLCACVFQ